MSKKLGKRCPECNKNITDRATRCQSCANSGKRSHKYKDGLGNTNRRSDNHCPECGVIIDDRATFCSSCSKKGKRSHKYKDGLGNLSTNLRHHRRDYIIDYAQWMKDVLERDNYQCQHCNEIKNLRVHHINAFAKYPELRTQLENGITLCEYHHRQLHQLFGINITPEQLKWFFANVK